jgi:hypothetical protein
MAEQPMTNDMLEEHSDTRNPILRRALIYTPAAVVTMGFFFFSLSGLLSGNAGAILPVVFLSLVGFALVYEAIASLRDLRAEPVVTEGEVDRVWKKSKLLMFVRQDYLLLQKQIFEVGPITAAELSVGQTVSIRHWPHTMRVVSVGRVRGDQKS